MTFVPTLARALMSHGGNDKHDHTLQTYVASTGDDVAAALVRRYGKGTDSDATDTMIVASTLKGQRGKGGGGVGPEETLVASPLEASDGHHGYSSPRGDGADNLIVDAPRSHNSGVPMSQRIHEDIAPTLASSKTPNRGGTEGPMIAAPLSHGSNPNSNAAGRRREDDFNLVAETVRSHPRPGSNSNGNVVAYGLNTNRGGNADVCLEAESTPPITNSHGNPGGVMQGASVRRLTPTECERLQGLPDGWTNPDGAASDSRRYAGLGDAVTATVGEWLGVRIMAADVARAGTAVCALKYGTPDDHGFLTCDRCRHCTKPFLLEDFCPEAAA